ncbi:hypothetical protein GGR08_001579 [Bartonella fuyuanensis]|uniref:Uncharacterized protein n=2 Tax=Bartonella fuyuanensis TaxID=1460968 RepID=A0A840DW72_9HYPH|nr:hypothetical protein [Bartonella fuyuanensis]
MDPQTASVASKRTSVEVAEEVDEADDTDDRLTMESAHALTRKVKYNANKRCCRNFKRTWLGALS